MKTLRSFNWKTSWVLVKENANAPFWPFDVHQGKCSLSPGEVPREMFVFKLFYQNRKLFEGLSECDGGRIVHNGVWIPKDVQKMAKCCHRQGRSKKHQ